MMFNFRLTAAAEVSFYLLSYTAISPLLLFADGLHNHLLTGHEIGIAHSFRSRPTSSCNRQNSQQAVKSASIKFTKPTTTLFGNYDDDDETENGNGNREIRRNEDMELLTSIVQRKQYEMDRFEKEHTGNADPIALALGYIDTESGSLRVSRSLARTNHSRRANAANDDGLLRSRRASFVVDVKRRSHSLGKGRTIASFDDAAAVAGAMASIGADCIFANVDYHTYEGNVNELRPIVRAVRQAAQKRNDDEYDGNMEDTAVVMKDFVVHEMQIGIAKDAGADGVYLVAAILGGELRDFLDTCTRIGIEAVVEVHTLGEAERALEAGATTIVVNNWDRLQGKFHPEQAESVIRTLPTEGGVLTVLATGGIRNAAEANRLIDAGYQGVVVGAAIMASTETSAFINSVRDREALPAEFTGWGMEEIRDYQEELDRFDP